MKESYLELGLEYFKTEGIKLSHTTDSSIGDIDVEQVVKGEEDIFFSESPERTLEKKKIIVTDWDVFGSNLNTGQYGSKKTSFYKQLLGDGFELYTYYNGSLKRLNSIDDLSIFWIRIASDRLIKDIAAKMGFASNEILIIGPISILPFINENEYSVKVSDLVNDFNSEEGSYMNALFSEILEKGSIKLTLVADSTIDYDAISDDLDGLDKVLSQFDKVTIDAKNFKEPKDLIDILLKLTNIKSIDFKNVEYIFLDFSLKNIPPHVKEINIDGKTADITNWQEIIDSKDISIKFELETLSLSYFGSRAKTYLRLLTGDRVKVQNINLKNIGVNTHVFSQLLNAPELNIYSVDILDRPEYTLMNYIYGVRVLHFWKTNISFEWLKLVISGTAVELVIFTDLALTGIAPDFILPTSVKEIKLTNVKISFKN